MLFSDSHRFLFVHVSKTGGSNLELALLPYVQQTPRTLYNRIRRITRTGDYRQHLFKQHDTVAYAQRVLPPEVFADCFKFALVRNPWDLLVSLYLFLRRMQSHRHHALVKSMSFESFVDFEIKRDARHQHHFLLGKGGEMLLDYIGRYERLEREFDFICDHLDVPRPELERHGVYKREPYQAYYDDSLRERVANHWARDIELLGYRYEDYDQEDIVERTRGHAATLARPTPAVRQAPS